MTSTIDQNQFRKFVLRSVSLPIAVSVTLSGVFVFLILHLVSLNDWVDHSNRVVAQTHELLQLCVDAETGVRGYLVNGEEIFLEPYDRSVESIDKKFADAIELTVDNPQQSGRLFELQARFKQWREYGEQKIDLKREKKDHESILSSMEGKRLMDDIRLRFDRIIKTEEMIRDQRSKKTVDTVTMALFGILIGSIIAGSFLAFYTRKQLMALSNVFSSALQKQVEQNLILEEQEWLQTGQAELAHEVRGDQTLEDISTKVLNYFIRRLDARVGALYNLESGVLRRMASYATNAQTDKKSQTFKLGESLVGQVAVENKPLTIQDVPDDYMNITSGIGETKPKVLVLFPLAVGGVTKAVVELGFMDTLQNRNVEFLELVSESMAIAMKSAEYRVLLANLLEEAQRQTEELQAQQEELQTSNEELEEQANALKTSQQRLETQQVELEQTNNQLSKQSRDLEIQAQAVSMKNQELLEAQMKLEDKARELELSSQYKSQFMANMSHELRTPLNSTLILAQLLVDNKRNRLGDEEVEFANTILSSSNNLLTLINDILDLSKVEAGKIDLFPEAIEVKTITSDLKRLFSPIADNKKIGFKIDLDPRVPETLSSDRQRLEQILKNLLSNAIKFTTKGGVTLKISVPEENPKLIDFTVIDTGIGISLDQQNVIFDAFKQADGTTSRKYGGTGLGLTISRDLAKLLGGEIIVRSEVEKGSEFILRLPHDMNAKASTLAATPELKKLSAGEEVRVTKVEKAIRKALPFADDRDNLNEKRRILLVIEDDTAFGKILLNLSHELHFNCIIAQTADEGLEMAREFLPQAIILDMHLPDHSGLTVLDNLKMDARTRHIPVHIISAQDQDHTALQMGAVGFLKKPVELHQIKDAIHKMELKFGQGMKNVLVVEDDKAQRESIRELIQDEMVSVTIVETAGDALKFLKDKNFDCMILDLHLPDMSGYDLLEKMANSEDFSHPPVIVYTGRDLSRAEEEKLQKYSQSIILKGAHSPGRLLSEVTLFLHQVEGTLTKDRQLILQEMRNREKIFEYRKILLVDDDVRNIFALSSALEAKGAIVETARNGLEAVEKVKSDPEIELVLMDIMMPEMDGYEAMREIRKDARFEKLPIIAVTAKAMADDQEKCREAGANDYLAKPIDLQKLLSLLRVWMPRKRR